MPSEKAMKAAEHFMQWMIRTPVISRDNPQEEKLAEAFDKFAAEAVAEREQKITFLEDRLFALGEMNKPPCFCCGYNSEGYYQPSKHKCAERHHELAEKEDE